MKNYVFYILSEIFIGIILLASFSQVIGQTYKIVDTGQEICYDSLQPINPPEPGEMFYGQDAQINGNQTAYNDNGDGTVTDLVTGLIWQKDPDLNGDGAINYDDKLTYDEAVAGADTFSLAGYSDWRLPTIKELYSLIMFSGSDPSGPNPVNPTPFINTGYFDFEYGDTIYGERIIDAQYWSSTEYVGTTMNNDPTTFGVNFADGRIKGYASQAVGPPGMQFTMKSFVRYVRGNSDYGVNIFTDNEYGTITDEATGLIWDKNDSGEGMTWEQALGWVAEKNQQNHLGHNDWRLPNAKEMQSIVDYSRSPQTTNSAAIDPVFNISSIIDEGGNVNYPFFWTGTTHATPNVMGEFAVYIAFGEALGWMETPPNSGSYELWDVHGAGAQRSDPKFGDPENYPLGHGPQGDVVRIYNFVRLVRGGSGSTGIGENYEKAEGLEIYALYPNPAHKMISVDFIIPEIAPVELRIIGLNGKCYVSEGIADPASGTNHVAKDISGLDSGIYLMQVVFRNDHKTDKFVVK